MCFNQMVDWSLTNQAKNPKQLWKKIKENISSYYPYFGLSSLEASHCLLGQVWSCHPLSFPEWEMLRFVFWTSTFAFLYTTIDTWPRP